MCAGCVGATLQNDDPRANIIAAITKSPLAIGLSQKEIAIASQSEMNALENGATGLPVKWAAGENSRGSVTPGQSFSIGTATCRRYKRTIEIRGLSKSESATACKNDEGIWSALE